MSSFISILSLFLLVLASGYYTAPVTVETTTLSNELNHETTEVPKHALRSLFEPMEPEATSPEDTTEEYKSQGLRLVPSDDKDELSTPKTITQERPDIHTSPDTLESPTEGTEQQPPGSHSHGAENESEEETGKGKPNSGKPYERRGMLDESITTTTTPIMPSYSTSSSTIIPDGSTSTIKYIGLLKDDESKPTEVKRPEKPNKPRPKPEEPTATLGSTIVDVESIPEIGTDRDGTMQYDGNTIPSITDPSTTTMEGKPKPPKKPLNEGEKSPQSEEEKSNQ